MHKEVANEIGVGRGLEQIEDQEMDRDVATEGDRGLAKEIGKEMDRDQDRGQVRGTDREVSASHLKV